MQAGVKYWPLLVKYSPLLVKYSPLLVKYWPAVCPPSGRGARGGVGAGVAIEMLTSLLETLISKDFVRFPAVI